MPNPANSRVLIVNDDGIDGPGIVLLEELVREFTDDVWVVAPDEERSGAGHSMSLAHPIRMKQRDERHFAVKGTPTDCVLLGIHQLLTDRRPDMLLTGINRGPNLAEDITYSGTASAAIEGALMGIPSIALSQIIKAYGQPVHWETSRTWAPRVIRTLLGMQWRPGVFVNVNFPGCPPEQVAGIRVTRQGVRPSGAFHPVRRVDERHVPYYWIKASFPDAGHEHGNDLQAARDDEVSITPMQIDLTAHELIPDLTRLFQDATTR